MPIAPKDSYIFKLKETHKSGVEPHTWLCGWCGKSLKNEEHVLGLQHGLRYCKKCFTRGKSGKDVETISDEDWLHNTKLDYGRPVKPRRVDDGI